MGLISWLRERRARKSLMEPKPITPERSVEIKASNDKKQIIRYATISKTAIERAIPLISSQFEKVDNAATKTAVTQSYAGDTQNEMQKPMRESFKTHLPALRDHINGVLLPGMSNAIKALDECISLANSNQVNAANSIYSSSIKGVKESVDAGVSMLMPVEDVAKEFLSGKNPVGNEEMRALASEINKLSSILTGLNAKVI